MIKKLLILADPKAVIFDPATGKRVPPEGLRVNTRDPFWRRRLKEGSMIEAPAAAPAAAPHKPTTEA